MQELRERLKVLCGDSKDKARLVEVANQLKNEGYRVSEILKLIKKEIGVGLSLRTTFSKPGRSEVDVKVKAKASEIVEKRVQGEVVAEAKKRIDDVLETGKRVLDRIEGLARHHGYANVADFIEMIYGFWDLNRDYVPKLEEKVLELASENKELEKIADPEIKRILLHNKMSELLQSFTWLSMVTGNFPSPLFFYGIRKTLASILYDELEIETSRGKIKLFG